MPLSAKLHNIGILFFCQYSVIRLAIIAVVLYNYYCA